MSRARPRRSRLYAAVGAVVAAGAVVSVVAALGRADAVMDRRRAEFDRSATDLTTALSAELRRNGDLLASAGAYIAASEDVTNAEFQEWFDRAAAGRYEGLLAFAFVEWVAADELDAYVADQAGDPGALTTGAFQLAPPGERQHYCLPRLSARQPSDVPVAIPPGTDLCALDDGTGASLHRIAAEGHAELLPLLTSADALGAELSDRARSVSGSTFMMAAPVHVAGDRHDLLGWVVAPLDGPSLLSAVLDGRDGLGVRLAWHGDTDLVIAERAPSRTDHVLTTTRVFDVDGEWTLRLVQPVAASTAAARSDRNVVIVVGLVLTGLVAALLAALLFARDHALRLVDHKTDELRHQALHDALTGLPNRVLVLDRAEQLLARGRREGRLPVAMFVDVDHFKRINDTLGHAAGDEVLRGVADRLRSVVRDADTVGRIGGDEFVVLADGAALAGSPEALADRVLAVMAEPFVLESVGGSPVGVRVSIGLAVGGRSSADELLRDADLALYEAKQAGRSCWVAFDPAMQDAVEERLQLELDLGGALAGDQLRLVYQPAVALEDAAVIGVEALLRWDHPTRGVVPPMTFVPLAEENGTIHEIGAWVLGEACRQGAAWHEAGMPVSVAVNVSVRQLESDDILGVVEAALADSGFPPASLVLEVTESTLMTDPDATARRLAALKGLGVRIAVDDFGTGYSSLAYLQRFPVDTLKIDRSFVTRMTESSESQALVHTLVRLGKTLGIETFAEGIEDAEQLRQLRDEDCDAGQGYLFARPLDVDDATAFLASHDVRAPAAPAATR